jgi:hypothetical protein
MVSLGLEVERRDSYCGLCSPHRKMKYTRSLHPVTVEDRTSCTVVLLSVLVKICVFVVSAGPSSDIRLNLCKV